MRLHKTWLAMAMLQLACTTPGQPHATDASTRDASLKSDANEVTDFVAVTLNTHSFQEGPSSVAKLESIGVALASLDADLVGLNEVMSGEFWAYDMGGASHDGTELIRTALERASGVSWTSHRVGFAHWDTGETMSNVLLSRWPLSRPTSRPLTTTDFWPAPSESRNAIYAQLSVEGCAIDVVVTHTWGWDSVDASSQIRETKEFLDAQSMPGSCLRVILGDLNTPAGSTAYDEWLGPMPSALVDSYAVINTEENSADDRTVVSGDERIDYILSDSGAHIEDSYRVFDGSTRGSVTTPIVSDHFGVLTKFSIPR